MYLFNTILGRLGIVWSSSGLLGVALPGANDRAVAARLRQLSPGAAEQATPSEGVLLAVAAIRAHLDGTRSPAGEPGLNRVVLDMSRVDAFRRRVYEVVREIPVGQAWTYGRVADEMGSPGAARAVGRALGGNPFPLIVPCHRVVAAHGRPGGFSAHGGLALKQRLLQLEGVLPPGPPGPGWVVPRPSGPVRRSSAAPDGAPRLPGLG